MFPLKEAQSIKATITQRATKLSSTKSYPGKIIGPIILHINFCKDRTHFHLKCPEKKSTQNNKNSYVAQ